jgi:hypothetical protein
LTGCVTLRVNGRLHHIGIGIGIGIGRTHTGTHVLQLVQDHHIRVIHAATGELLRELVLDPPATTSPPADHQDRPRKAVARTYESWVRAMPLSCDITRSG